MKYLPVIFAFFIDLLQFGIGIAVFIVLYAAAAAAGTAGWSLGALVGFFTGCVLSIWAGCIPGGLVGAGVGTGVGGVAGQAAQAALGFAGPFLSAAIAFIFSCVVGIPLMLAMGVRKKRVSMRWLFGAAIIEFIPVLNNLPSWTAGTYLAIRYGDRPKKKAATQAPQQNPDSPQKGGASRRTNPPSEETPPQRRENEGEETSRGRGSGATVNETLASEARGGAARPRNVEGVLPSREASPSSSNKGPTRTPTPAQALGSRVKPAL